MSDKRSDNDRTGDPADDASRSDSPFDEPTGRIPVQPPAPGRSRGGSARGNRGVDRDSFYERHARRPRADVSRVDDLDDLDPGEVGAVDQSAGRRPPPTAPTDESLDHVENQRSAARAGDARPPRARESTQSGGRWTQPPSSAPTEAVPAAGQRGRREPQPTEDLATPAAADPPPRDPEMGRRAADAAPTEAFDSGDPAEVETSRHPMRGDDDLERGNHRRDDRDGLGTDTTAGVGAGAAAGTAAAEPAAATRAYSAVDDPDEGTGTDLAGARTQYLGTDHHDEPELEYRDPDRAADDAGSGRARQLDELEEAERRARRGTLDLGLLVLRIAVGGVMLAHGLQKLFGIWNGPGLNGFTDILLNHANTAIGFSADAAKPLAIVWSLVEAIGGLMVLVGLLTPIGAAGLLCVSLLSATFKTAIGGGFEFFAAQGGVELELLIAVAAAGLVLTGPGLYSVDYPRGWARRPFAGSVLWLVVGVAVAVAVWALANGANPLDTAGNPR